LEKLRAGSSNVWKLRWFNRYFGLPAAIPVRSFFPAVNYFQVFQPSGFLPLIFRFHPLKQRLNDKTQPAAVSNGLEKNSFSPFTDFTGLRDAHRFSCAVSGENQSTQGENG
jgi:hypothetical protein